MQNQTDIDESVRCAADPSTAETSRLGEERFCSPGLDLFFAPHGGRWGRDHRCALGHLGGQGLANNTIANHIGIFSVDMGDDDCMSAFQMQGLADIIRAFVRQDERAQQERFMNNSLSAIKWLEGVRAEMIRRAHCQTRLAFTGSHLINCLLLSGSGPSGRLVKLVDA